MDSGIKWILDTDCGVDDMQAILLALDNLDLLAITCVSGNADVSYVVKNVAIIQGLKGTSIPIYEGCARPILKKMRYATEYHGIDGFGNQQEKFIDKATLELIQKEHAVNALIRIAQEESAKGTKLGLISVGPVTNLGMACRLDTKFATYFEKYYCMGGTVNGWGNMSFTGEFNLWADPEASRIVFEDFKLVHLLPWETADEFVVSDSEKELLYKEEEGCEVSKLFKTVNTINDGIDGRLYCCDGLCMAAAIDPSIVIRDRTAYGKVETQGEVAGSIFFNMCKFLPEGQGSENVHQLLEVDHDRYIQMLKSAIVSKK